MKSDLYNRGHNYIEVKLDDSFPEYIVNNRSKFKNLFYNNVFGEVAEWLKAHAWKVCKGETLSWVQSHSLLQF